MVVRDLRSGRYNLILNTIVISLAIVLNSSIDPTSALHRPDRQDIQPLEPQQAQPFEPAKLGLPTRREGGGCR